MDIETPNALIPSLKIDSLIANRNKALALVAQAQKLLLEAESIAQATFPNPHRGIASFFSRRGYTYASADFLGDKGLKAVEKEVDAAGWEYLLEQSGLKSFMNNKRREDFQKSIHDRTFPPLCVDAIMGTITELHEHRGDMMEDGVVEIYRSLSWDYKTNSPQQFGAKIILNRFCEYWKETRHMRFVGYNGLDDLIRVMCMLDGKPEPDHRNGMHFQLETAHQAGANELENDYLKVRWYRKGSGHVTFRDQRMVDQMNRIIARRFPNVLGADRAEHAEEKCYAQ
ncbi:DUF4942 domain-containing protein [Acidithiobacillus ferrivorans]|nr:DUF4942 domain-containing protein [Acidithiobacillus ferrivorans]